MMMMMVFRVFTEVLGIVQVLSFKILTKSGHPTPSLTTITFAESTCVIKISLKHKIMSLIRDS